MRACFKDVLVEGEDNFGISWRYLKLLLDNSPFEVDYMNVQGRRYYLAYIPVDTYLAPYVFLPVEYLDFIWDKAPLI